MKMEGINKKMKVEPESEAQDAADNEMEMEQCQKKKNALKSRKSRVKSKTTRETTVDYLRSAMMFLATAAQENLMDLDETANDSLQTVVSITQRLTSQAPKRSPKDDHINTLAEGLKIIGEQFCSLSQKKRNGKRKAEALEDSEGDGPEASIAKRSVDQKALTQIHADHVKLPENAQVTVNLYQTITSVTTPHEVFLSSGITEKLVEDSSGAHPGDLHQPTATLNTESDIVTNNTGGDSSVPARDDQPEAIFYVATAPAVAVGPGYCSLTPHEEDEEEIETKLYNFGGVTPPVHEMDHAESNEQDPELKEKDSTGFDNVTFEEPVTEVDGQGYNAEETRLKNPAELPFESQPELQDLVQSSLEDPDCKCV